MLSIEEMRDHLATIDPPVVGDPLEFCRRAVLTAGDARWGLWRNPGKPTPSGDILAVRGAYVDRHNGDQRRDYQIFDCLRASDGPDVAVTWDGPHTQRDGAEFVELLPAQGPVAMPARSSSLPRLAIRNGRFVTGAEPFTWIGATAFDLPVRLAHGDDGFAQFLAESGFTIARVVVATYYRHPRDLDEGIDLTARAAEYLAAYGIYTEATVLCDALDFQWTAPQMLDGVARMGRIAEQMGTIAIEGANEIGHGGQHPILSDPSFLRELAAAVPAGVPCAVGSSHGGVGAIWDQGSYVTHHSDRALSIDDNAGIMATAQQQLGKPVIDDEPMGIAEQARPAARVADAEQGHRQALAAVVLGYGSTLHLDAGLPSSAARLGPIQWEAARRFVATMRGER